MAAQNLTIQGTWGTPSPNREVQDDYTFSVPFRLARQGMPFDTYGLVAEGFRIRNIVGDAGDKVSLEVRQTETFGTVDIVFTLPYLTPLFSFGVQYLGVATEDINLQTLAVSNVERVFVCDTSLVDVPKIIDTDVPREFERGQQYTIDADFNVPVVGLSADALDIEGLGVEALAIFARDDATPLEIGGEPIEIDGDALVIGQARETPYTDPTVPERKFRLKVTPEDEEGIQQFTLKEGSVSTARLADQILPPRIDAILHQYYRPNIAIDTLSPRLLQGTQPVTWSATGLPAGLSIASATGNITGTPTTNGTSTVQLTASNTAAGAGGGTDTISFQITVGQSLNLSTPPNQTFLQGGGFSLSLPEASGGTAPYQYFVVGGPPEATFNAFTRVLSATTLNTPGVFTVTYRAIDSSNPIRYGEVTFTITVQSNLSFVSVVTDKTYKRDVRINPLTLPEAQGGVTPYSYTVSGLPPGLQFDASTRQITGIPSTDGSYAVTYEVADAPGALQQTATQTFKINVSSLAISQPFDLVYQVNKQIAPYTLPAATGGSGTYTYSVTGLPTGLVYTAATHQITGTPTSKGFTVVTITVTDTSQPQQTATVYLHINVTALVWSTTQEDIFVGCGVTYTYKLPKATGPGLTFINYSISTLPANWTFDATTRTLTGATATTASKTQIVYTATGSDGTFITQTFDIHIIDLDGTVTRIGTANGLGANITDAQRLLTINNVLYANRSHAISVNTGIAHNTTFPYTFTPPSGYSVYRAAISGSRGFAIIRRYDNYHHDYLYNLGTWDLATGQIEFVTNSFNFENDPLEMVAIDEYVIVIYNQFQPAFGGGGTLVPHITCQKVDADGNATSVWGYQWAGQIGIFGEVLLAIGSNGKIYTINPKTGTRYELGNTTGFNNKEITQGGTLAEYQNNVYVVRPHSTSFTDGSVLYRLDECT